jgi:hypothetical protein
VSVAQHEFVCSLGAGAPADEGGQHVHCNLSYQMACVAFINAAALSVGFSLVEVNHREVAASLRLCQPDCMPSVLHCKCGSQELKR